MADQVIVTYDDDTVTVVSVADQGPPGVSGSSVPATTSTLGGIIVGANLSITGNGVLSANGTSNLPFANLTGLPATLALHGITDGLTTANASTTYSVLGHTHTIPNVTGLQTALDGKQVSGSYVLTSNSALTDARTPLAHTQAFSTLTALPATLAAHGITDGLLATTAASTYVTASDANNAFVAKTISVIAGTGLTGGGALSVCRTLSLAVSNVTAGTYGSATVVPVVTVDIYGRITSVSNIAISGGGGGVTSVTGGTGITVTACTTAPVVSIDSAVVATLTGTQTLSSKTLASPTISDACLTTSISCNSAPIRRGGTQREQMDASWTVTEGVCGAILVCNSAIDMTLTFPSGLSSGFNLTVLQAGGGKITIAAGSGVTLYGRNGLKTAAQYAVIGIFSAVATNTFFVTGDTTT